MKKTIILFLAVWLGCALQPREAGAEPASESTTRLAAQGWLNESVNRLAKPLPNRIADTRSFADQAGTIIYRAVDLAPEGYIIVAADNDIDPINANLQSGLPVTADYDGDGKTDPALYHPASGTWQAQLSGGQR